MGFEKQGPALEQALETHEVPHKVTVYNHAPHSIGTGRGRGLGEGCCRILGGTGRLKKEKMK